MVIRHRFSREPIDRFIEKIKKTPTCWLWTGAKCNTFGHGRFDIGINRAGHRGMSAHRASWILHYGEIEGKFYVLHKCRTHDCVNPDHLYLGTQKENTDDMFRDGTKPLGEIHKNSKLTEKIVKEIRRTYIKQKTSVWKMAEKYGVQGPTIWKIINRKAWKHI